MNNILSRTLLCAALATSLTMAQGPRRGGGGSGDRLERLATELNLTDGQKEQLKPIFEEQGKKMQELRADTSLDRRARFEKMREIQEDSQTKINPILNDEQKKKWEDIKAQGRERMKERRRQ